MDFPSLDKEDWRVAPGWFETVIPQVRALVQYDFRDNRLNIINYLGLFAGFCGASRPGSSTKITSNHRRPGRKALPSPHQPFQADADDGVGVQFQRRAVGPLQQLPIGRQLLPGFL